MARVGIYEEIINKKLSKELIKLDNTYDYGKEAIDVEDARKILAQYISNITRKALSYIREKNNENKALIEQIRTCNAIIDVLSKELEEDEFKQLQIEENGEILTHIYSKINSDLSLKKNRVIRPVTPISQSSLFTGSYNEPSMVEEMKREILTSDSIDFLVSFIKWSGIRCIIDELKDFTMKGGKLRIITTSYMEATDYKAIIELSKLPNTQIKISYDVKRTRLHAKAYLFKRNTGFSTAYIGSSNISNPALTTGLEWNIKVTEKDSFDIIKKFISTYESYWNNNEFELFNSENEFDASKLKQALSKEKENIEVNLLFNIQPYHYQKEILEKLQVEREIFGRNKNLIVAATGVGKTVISAFDFKNFQQTNNHSARLLFVAHREEILEQSLYTFRTILRDQNFGDILVGSYEPESLENLFISIQSFHSKKLYEITSVDFYDFIIVDEFHHAAAKSYEQLLKYYKPKVLLGLTATPERMDGQNVLEYFDNRIAAEIRLADAINQKLLCPFQYFCVSDSVDLSEFKWGKKGYEVKELENVYIANDYRTNEIIKSVNKYVTDLNDVKGLGFCVSVEHAKYMADSFNNAGIPSLALYAEIDKKTRRTAQNRLTTGDIKFIFVVDLYNEGVDIPEINTILFLRPTESLTVFIQQLGRGLRLTDDKECLTVLDFVGRAHKNYDVYERKFRSLLGPTKHSVRYYVENGFFNLPKGCYINLEKQAKNYILDNLKSVTNTKSNLINKLKYFSRDTGKELSLIQFISHYNMSLYDFYGKNGNRTFSRMLVEAGCERDFMDPNEDIVTKRIPYLFHLNSPTLLRFLMSYIETREVRNEEEQLMLSMFYYTFYNNHPKKEGFRNIEDGINSILSGEKLRKEIEEVLRFTYETIDMKEIDNDFPFICPLRVHSKYTSSQILAALGYYNDLKSPSFREGVLYIKEKKLDIFFITLYKSEKEFSPSTLYEDYAINEKLFHWQTQSRVSEDSKTAQRYIHHRNTNNQIALFVREYKKENGYTSPFIFLGTANYVKHYGNKPMSIIWRLNEEMPPYLVQRANKNII